MIHYLKSRIWDWLLCICISVGLVFHIYSGFILEDAISSNVLAVIGFMAVLMMLLFLFAYNRWMTGLGIAAGIVLLIGFLVYIRANNVFEEETANSLCITLTITIITAFIVFLACRTRAGIITLFLIGNIVIAGSYFLQYPVQLWSFYLFVFTIFVMLWYRNYSAALLKVHAGKVRMKRYLLQTVCICLVAIVLAGGAYVGIVKPLNPPTRALKLIIKLEDMELLQVLGMTTPKELLDPNLRSSQQATGTEDSSNPGEEDNQENGEEPESKESDEDKPDSKGENQTTAQMAQAVHYVLNEQTIPWIAIGILIAIILLICLRIFLRKYWERRIAALSLENQVINYYQLFLRKLSLAGYRKPVNYTLSEYALDMEHELSEFADKEDGFVHLTEIYAGTFYGRQTVSAEEAKLFEQFYKEFYKNLRREMGTFRYFLKVVLHLGKRGLRFRTENGKEFEK